MSTHLLLLLALAGSDSVVNDGSPLSFAVDRWTADELKLASRDVVVRSRDVRTFDAVRDVPDLVLMRSAVLDSPVLNRSEQIQARNRIDYCLEQAYGRLLRQQARLDKQPSKESSRSPEPPSDTGLAGGSGAAVQAQQLIGLIEATIQPESWANNGGLGTIQYWGPGYALVIRNSQAVHGEIGGLIGILEAQQR